MKELYMKYMSAQQIRTMWLEFFADKKHLIEPSASLIPSNDPTLLWVNAGVAPLKKYFDGSEIPPSKRMTNVQKCIRTNDIDNVGKTARHHTFFEMMGNFSIGDYFRVEAIQYGFELLTSNKWFNLPVEKLYITYYPDDEITKQTWIECGVSIDNLIPFSGNFWEIGAGPSGPCTEIFYDRGSQYDSRGKELIEQDLDNDRFIEIWNIVFSQYNANPEVPRSQYQELPNKNIDTGAGLERFACVLQEVETNFETDLFFPIIQAIEHLANVKYEGQMAFKVIADHIKTLVFSVADGAMLSNEGRGYVLRRILRRAIKYGIKLSFSEPFLYKLIPVVVKMMESAYPNLGINQTIIEKIILKEEEKFFLTITDGEKLLISEINNGNLSAEAAFKLYDTYGFPIELTMEYAQENQVSIDLMGFNHLLNEQKQRSRNARNVDTTMNQQDETFLNFTVPSKFIGYDQLSVQAKVIGVFDQGIVLDQTPFYATSGGQLSDRGTINGLTVIDVVKLPQGQFLHLIETDSFDVGNNALAIVDVSHREETIKNHTATHLLHQALKEVLGTHVLQQGSLVSSELLRFDFNHFETPTREEILKIEEIVNQQIKASRDVVVSQMSLEEAKILGAMALFGEKYANIVRVVNIKGFSIELCVGTHVSNTKEIKLFAIGAVESIGSGIYRIEAFTDQVITKIKKTLINVSDNIIQLENKAKSMSNKHQFNSKPQPTLIGSYQDILNYRQYLEILKNDVKTFEKDLTKLQSDEILSNVDQFIPKVFSNKEVIIVNDLPMNVLKQLIDILFDKMRLETLLLINKTTEKISYLCKTKSADAGKIIKKLAELTNGSGGGKPDFAQGGTQNLINLAQALSQIKELL